MPQIFANPNNNSSAQSNKISVKNLISYEMKKERSSTLQQRLGFADNDLKLPKHDELMLWLNENISRIIDENVPKNLNDLFTSKFKESVQNTIKRAINYCENQSTNNNIDYKSRIHYLQNLNLFEKKYIRNQEVKIIKKEWEYAINAKSKHINRDFGNIFTVGFVDMAVTYSKIATPHLEGIYDNPQGPYYNSHERIEIRDEVKIIFKEVTKTIFIEVKTKIESLGELIRQINLYKVHNPGDYFVLCPKNPYKKTLLEQGIFSIDYIE